MPLEHGMGKQREVSITLNPFAGSFFSAEVNTILKKMPEGPRRSTQATGDHRSAAQRGCDL